MRNQVSGPHWQGRHTGPPGNGPMRASAPTEKNAAIPRIRRLPEPHLSPPQQRRCQRGECQALGHHQISGSERRGGGVRLNHPRLCVDGKARLTCKTARRVVAPYTGWKPAPSSVTASPCHLPPRGKALERWRRNPPKLEITSAAPIPPFCILHGTHDSFLMKFSKSRVAI